MTLSRRRFLHLTSAACLVASAAPAYQWQGTALGAKAQIILDHPEAKAITQRALAEISRLEGIFSLYRKGSELSRLNQHGQLAAPSFELLECLSLARRVYGLTEGRFDPTVQPLWQVMAEAYSRGAAPNQAELARARDVIGFDRVAFDDQSVRLSAGQGLTFNGIAQGYIADRVADLMRNDGVDDVLVDTGEIVAMGKPAGHKGWPVTINGERHARALSGRALATSALTGTVFDGTGTVGHILDPATGASVETDIRQISISAGQAGLADALSTGLCAAKDAKTVRRLLRNVKDAKLESLQTVTETL